MALDAESVYIGLADQSSATGAISSGAVIAAANVPTTFTAATAAIAAFTASGYVSEDGLTLSTDYSTTDVKEWNGATVRKLLESFDGTLSFSLIQTDEAGWAQAFGAENITTVAADNSHGKQLHISLGAHLPAPKAWAFKMKDGDAKFLVLVCNGQITAVDDITFNATEPIALPCTLSCYDDGTGESIHIFTDDGKTL